MRTSIRHITPVRLEEAKGIVADVYTASTEELGILGPIVQMLSPTPEIILPVWALLRESLLVGGKEERLLKEVVATAAAVKNGCRFCTAAHAGFLDLLSPGDMDQNANSLGQRIIAGDIPDQYMDLVAWARNPQGPPPCEAEAAPRFIAALLVTEMIARLVDVMVRVPSSNSAVPTEMASSYSKALEKALELDLEPGVSVQQLQEMEAKLARGDYYNGYVITIDVERPQWDLNSPVGEAYAYFQAFAELGRGLVGGQGALEIEKTVAAYFADIDGTTITQGDVLTSEQEVGLDKTNMQNETTATGNVKPGSGDFSVEYSAPYPQQALRGINIATLSALNPGYITDQMVADWRKKNISEHCTVFLFTFGVAQALKAFEGKILKANSR